MRTAYATLLFAFVAAISLDAAAHDHGHGHGHKEVYWDGPCKVERKYKHGEVKEKRKCKAPQPAYIEQPPAVVVQPVLVPVQPGIVIQGAGAVRIP